MNGDRSQDQDVWHCCENECYINEDVKHSILPIKNKRNATQTARLARSKIIFPQPMPSFVAGKMFDSPIISRI